MFIRNLSGSQTSRPKKKVSFAYDVEEPTDREFHDLYTKFASSPWFVINFLLCMSPFFWAELLSCSRVSNLNVQITCLMPELMNKMQWNASAVRNLTMPHLGRACTFVDYNYSIFHRMDPEEAFFIKSQIDNELKQSGKNLKVKRCARPIIPEGYSFVNYTRNFLMTCSSFLYRRHAISLAAVTSSIACITTGILCDLFGRKPVFIVFLVVFLTGAILQSFVDNYYKLLATYALQIIGKAGTLFSNYILFLEMCETKWRSLMGLYIFIASPFGLLVCLSTKGYIEDLRAALHLYTLPVALLVFRAYFLPESPRWLLSYGKKRRAWKILEDWGEEVPLEKFLPALQQNPFKTLYENFKILFGIKKYRRTVFIMTYYEFVAQTILVNVRRYVKIKAIGANSHKYLVFMAELCSYLCIIPPFILCGRYVTLAYQLSCATICLVLSLFIEKGEGWYILNLLSAQYLYGLELIIYLYSCELLPTATRGTGLAIILGGGRAMAVVSNATVLLFIASQRTAAVAETVVFLLALVIGSLLVPLLPNRRVVELPDWKRYRNVMTT